MEINCKIISVNTNSSETLDSVQSFGHQSSDDGRKLRYVKRRKIVEDFKLNFTSVNFNLEIFDAVTPSKFTIDNSEIIFEDGRFSIKDTSPFYIANFLSHYKIWKTEEDTLILEDDVIFGESNFQEIYTLINKFKDSDVSTTSILYLQISTPWNISANDKIINYVESIDDAFSIASNMDFSGTSAYFITNDCKKILLNNLQPVFATDGYLDLLRKSGTIRYCVPSDKSLMFKLNTETMWL